MLTGIAHICIGSRDLDSTEDFYCKGLGMTRRFNFWRDGSRFGFYLDAGNRNFIEVFQDDEPQQPDRPLVRHLCLETGDIDEFIETARANGIEVGDKSLGADQSWQCWLTDPDGLKIEVHQYTPESKQFSGEDCVVDW